MSNRMLSGLVLGLSLFAAACAGGAAEDLELNSSATRATSPALERCGEDEAGFCSFTVTQEGRGYVDTAFVTDQRCDREGPNCYRGRVVRARLLTRHAEGRASTDVAVYGRKGAQRTILSLESRGNPTRFQIQSSTPKGVGTHFTHDADGAHCSFLTSTPGSNAIEGGVSRVFGQMLPKALAEARITRNERDANRATTILARRYATTVLPKLLLDMVPEQCNVTELSAEEDDCCYQPTAECRDYAESVVVVEDGVVCVHTLEHWCEPTADGSCHCTTWESITECEDAPVAGDEPGPGGRY